MSITDLDPLSSPESVEVLREIEASGLGLADVLEFADQDFIESDEGQRAIVLAHLAAGDDSVLPAGLDAAEVAQLREPGNVDKLHELLNTVLYDSKSELRQEHKAAGTVDEWIDANRWPQQG